MVTTFFFSPACNGKAPAMVIIKIRIEERRLMQDIMLKTPKIKNVWEN
jgi:hypothetical protein